MRWCALVFPLLPEFQLSEKQKIFKKFSGNFPADFKNPNFPGNFQSRLPGKKHYSARHEFALTYTETYHSDSAATIVQRLLQQ